MRPLAILIWVSTLVGLVLAVVVQRCSLEPTLVFAPHGVLLRQVEVCGSPVLFTTHPVVPGWGTVGMLLAVRRSGNAIGWILLATAATPLAAVVFPLGPEVQNGIVVAGVALVLLLFPTGRPLGRVWVIPMVSVVVSWIALRLVGSISLRGFDLPIGVAVAAVSLVWCASAPIVRFRRVTGLERAQLRWLGFAGMVASATVVLVALGLVVDSDGLLEVAALLAGLCLMFGFPGAILVAVLRYRLFEIDRLVSRSVTFAIVVALVSAVYAIPTTLLPRLLGEGNAVVTAASTLAAAALFSPLRRRVHRAVEHRFNRTAFDAAREAEAFGARVRDDVDPAVVGGRLAETVGRTLQPRSVAIWIAGTPRRPITTTPS